METTIHLVLSLSASYDHYAAGTGLWVQNGYATHRAAVPVTDAARLCGYNCPDEVVLWGCELPAGTLPLRAESLATN